jgi:putative DNA primase/helicase
MISHTVFPEHHDDISLEPENLAEGVGSTDLQSSCSANHPDDNAEISRLASLSPLEYDRERKATAQKLGVRALSLDKLVKANRAEPYRAAEQGQALELPMPEPWPEPVDGAALLNDMASAISQYVIADEGAIESVALWVFHAWTLDAFPISPRLAITSPEKGCGKTTLLDVIGYLVPRALPTSNATTAAVFRVIEAAQPTLLIDEADTFLGKNEELRGILNSGHNRSMAFVMRIVGDEYEPRRFSTWAPTVIAMIGELPGTLEARAISIRLRRRRPDEPIKRFRADRCPELHMLARKAARWAAGNVDRLKAADPDVPASLQNRAADNWRTLLAIADAAGGDWPKRSRQIAESAGASQDTMSEGVTLLHDIRAIFEQKRSDRFRSEDLIGHLILIRDSPWGECQRGRALTQHGLAKRLRRYKIQSRTIRITPAKRGGKPTAKGYLRSQFDDAFQRYLPPYIPEEAVTSSQPI